MITVMLDAGHGAPDPGVVANGIIEKDWTLGLCIATHELYGGNNWDVRTVLSRSGDKNLTNQEVADAARTAGADLVISIHVDSFPSPKASGLRTYHLGQSTLAAEVASMIQKAVPSDLEGRERPIIPRPRAYPGVMAVLEPITVPALLVECGFATNEADAEYLKDPQGRLNILGTLTRGIARATEILEHRRDVPWLN